MRYLDIAMKDAVKEVKKVAVAGVDEVTDLLSKAYKAIDKAAKRGVIKKNTASRKKSRLALAVVREAGKKKETKKTR